MSKVKIQGHASGTGVLTVTAPNTSTDRTITLPNSTGTLIADDGSGNIGIGTAPNYKLNIHETGTSYLQITNGTTGTGASDGAYFGFVNADNTLRIINQENGHLRLSTNNTERLLITNDGRGLSQFTAKAWVYAKDVSGTPTIQDSHNISSITDAGTGSFQINFSNALGSSNYAWSQSILKATSSANLQLQERHDSPVRSTGSLALYAHSTSGGTLYDPQGWSVIFFGD